jgi:trehalose 6-phosphate synthase
LSRLVIVSNRVPRPDKAGSGNEGGLVVALRSAFDERGGMWFGWNGKVVSRRPAQPKIETAGGVTYATMGLSETDYQDYYFGFANRTLWPLFHYRMDLTHLDRASWRGYQRVNNWLSDKLRPMLKKDDVIWVHDYHLIPIAEKLRSAGCRNKIGFFLHTPWPAFEVLLMLPVHQNIVRALCAYDVVGFQTQRDFVGFRDYVVNEAGGKVSRNGDIAAFGQQFRAGAFPIGIDTEAVAEQAKRAAKSRAASRLKTSVNGRELIIGVDRLDYSKGLVQRIEAFAHLLYAYPENRREVTLLQISPPSREDVPEYAAMHKDLDAAIGHINGQYADPDWQPVRYINRGYSRRALVGFFRVSRVGLVTPLRDGMNLVAKEYVASQDPRDPGVLVLSRFAGAAQQLPEALIVNPYDVVGVGEALQTALRMRREERTERWSAMFDRLMRNNVQTWKDEFLKTLDRPSAAAHLAGTGLPAA